MGFFSGITDVLSDVTGAVGDIFSPISGLVSGVTSILGQNSANETNREIASANTAFQERMSNTAYQRSMADMKEAGLNPILSYKTGGATTPSGTTIAQQNVAGNSAASFSSVQNSALAMRKIQKELNLLDATERRETTQATQNQALTTKLIKEGEVLRNQIKLIQAQLPSQIQQAKYKAESPTLNKWRAFWDLSGNASSANQLWQIPLKRGLK